MPTAYVLINYEIGTEENFRSKLKNVPGVMEINEVNGVYDIVAKIASDTLDSLKEIITREIRTRYDQVDYDTNSNRVENKSCSLIRLPVENSQSKVLAWILRPLNKRNVINVEWL
jgi:DNA-binding Lrp family transcriptional regulator